MRALKSSRGQQKWSLSKTDLCSATNLHYARNSNAAAYVMCHSRILFLRHAHPAHRDCVHVLARPVPPHVTAVVLLFADLALFETEPVGPAECRKVSPCTWTSRARLEKVSGAVRAAG